MTEPASPRPGPVPGQPLHLVDHETWRAQADGHWPVKVEPVNFKIGARRGRITPSITEHDDLVVVGEAFVPVSADGGLLLEQAVHSPDTYLAKPLRAFSTEGGHPSLRVPVVGEVTQPCIVVGGTSNYYHWLVDFLPRLLLCLDTMPMDGLKLLLNEPQMPFQQQTLARLGFAPDAVVGVRHDEAVRLKQAIFPSLLATTTFPHPHIKVLLDKYLGPQVRPGPHRRIYLSRADAATRRLVNEEALRTLVRRHGFEVLVPGDMDFEAQVNAAAGAEVMLAVHGAGMSNMLFSRKGSKVLEIYSPHHKATFMKLLAWMCGLEHQFIAARNVSFGRDGNPLHGDWEIDLGVMERELQSLGPPAG